jgi:hypothetical protein
MTPIRIGDATVRDSPFETGLADATQRLFPNAGDDRSRDDSAFTTTRGPMGHHRRRSAAIVRNEEDRRRQKAVLPRKSPHRACVFEGW